jgi:DAK2 domain fusion protein YloV
MRLEKKMKEYDVKLAISAVRSAIKMLENYREKIDDMNIFPMADGDTGKNMLATCRGMLDGMADLPKGTSLEEFCRRATKQVLISSHGNSGTIFAKIILGFSDQLQQADELDLETLSKAAHQALLETKRSIAKPVDGTILTVLEDIANYIDYTYRFTSDSLTTMLNNLPAVAFKAVDKTPELMPLLKSKGVVDAGGLGLAILVEGFIAGLEKNDIEVSIYDKQLLLCQPKIDIEEAHSQDHEHIHCTELKFYPSKSIWPDKVIAYLGKMGDSVIFTSNDSGNMYKVHVHTNKPKAVIAYFKRRGRVEMAKASNMHDQAIKRLENLINKSPRQFGFVAVVPQLDMVELLKDVGMDLVIDSQRARRTLVKDILNALKIVGKYTEKVFVFLDTGRTGISAEQICQSAGDSVFVIDSPGAAQTISAMTALDESESATDNTIAFQTTIKRVRLAEITRADTKTKLENGTLVQKGDNIGVINMRGSSFTIVDDSRGDLKKVITMALDAILENASCLTVYHNQPDIADSIIEEYVEKLRQKLAKRRPGINVDFIYSGQTDRSLTLTLVAE